MAHVIELILLCRQITIKWICLSKPLPFPLTRSKRDGLCIAVHSLIMYLSYVESLRQFFITSTAMNIIRIKLGQLAHPTIMSY